MPPTRNDVARRANVSAATVSYVVNGGPRPVSAGARARVLDAIAALNYRPNLVARSLVRQRTHGIGLVVPDNANPFFAEFARQVEDVAFAHGYTVFLCNTNRDAARELAYLDLLLDKRVDGVITTSSGLRTEHLAPFRQSDVPLVLVDPSTPGLGFDSVRVDDELGGRLGTAHLIAHGYRDIACLAGPSDTVGANRRFAGYRQALAGVGITPHPEWVRYGPFAADSGYDRARVLLMGDRRPRAIFAHDDLLAIGVLRAAWDLGIRVPEELAVVGFDDISVARLMTPPLTSVVQPLDAIAEYAVSRLIQRMGKESIDGDDDRLITPRLAIRASCGCRATEEDAAGYRTP